MVLEFLKFLELILGFSRYSKKYSRFAIFLHSTLFVFFALSLSFCIFLFFGHYPTTSEEVFYVLGAFFVLALIAVLPFFWGKGMMYTVVSVCLFFLILYSLDKYIANDVGQYVAFFLDSYVDESINLFIAFHGNVIVAFICAFLVFELLPQFSCTLIISLNTIMLVALAGFIVGGIDPDFEEYTEKPSPTKIETGKNEDKNFIHIILSEHIGYSFAKELKKGKQIKTGKDIINVPGFERDISFIEDFYKKYRFSFYPHAYSIVSDPAEAISGVMNFDAVNAKEYFDDWRGGNFITSDVMNMPFSHNKLFNLFKDNGFDLSVYQNKFVDFCSADGGKVVSKCHTFSSFPGRLYKTDISTHEKSYLLVGHWLALHGILDGSKKTANLDRDRDEEEKQLSDVCGPLKSECEKLPLIGYSVNQSYPIGQLDILDKLKEDVVKSKGKNVFVASLLLPHHPYVYDKDCKLKENTIDWLSKDKSLFDLGDYERQLSVEAYIDHLSCVYKRLDSVFAEFKENKILDKSVVVIHGDRGFMLDFEDRSMEDYSIQEKTERRIKDKLSTVMAIYDPNKKEFKMNNEGCDTGTIFERYIYGRSKEEAVCKQVELSSDDDWIRDSLANWFRTSKETVGVNTDVTAEGLIDKVKKVKENAPLPVSLKIKEEEGYNSVAPMSPSVNDMQEPAVLSPAGNKEIKMEKKVDVPPVLPSYETSTDLLTPSYEPSPELPKTPSYGPSR